jgi:hypothetical protein
VGAPGRGSSERGERQEHVGRGGWEDADGGVTGGSVKEEGVEGCGVTGCGLRGSGRSGKGGQRPARTEPLSQHGGRACVAGSGDSEARVAGVGWQWGVPRPR